jgi:murein DD-endopeptidase MepM/ murein hydrolase activator NlpD
MASPKLILWENFESRRIPFEPQDDQIVTLDFQPPLGTRSVRKRSGNRLRYCLYFILAVLMALPFLFRPAVTSTEAHSSPEEAIQKPSLPDIPREILQGEIAQGDTLTALLGNYFTPQEIHQLGEMSKPIFPLSRICAGQPYKICLVGGEFERFEYDIDKEEQLFIFRNPDGFLIEKKEIPYAIESQLITGTIETSLFEAVTAAGEDEVLAMNLAEIFGWDIDFILDIRKGDSFKVLVEKRFREGRPAGYGRILSAEFINQGKSFQAILFTDGDQSPSYFAADGQSLRKAFLKAPLAFSRISSGFTMRRFHPVSKTWKAHPAIDYAAPTGTPIKTVGDGIISAKGYTRGNGNYLKIRHNNGYETLYLHMSRFASRLQQGSHVSQGQVIGYVGSTGLATGPHLCFRMRKNGAPVNPQKIKVPSVAPVSAENMEQFRAHAKTLLAMLKDPAVHLAAGQSDGPSRQN